MTNKEASKYEMPALLECPFCGNGATYYVGKVSWSVICMNPHCGAKVKGAWPDVAASAWNTRTNEFGV